MVVVGEGLVEGRTVLLNIRPSWRGPLRCMLSKCHCHLERGVFVCAMYEFLLVFAALCSVSLCPESLHTPERNLLTSCFVSQSGCFCMKESLLLKLGAVN